MPCPSYPCPICNPEESGPIRNQYDIERIAALEAALSALADHVDKDILDVNDKLEALIGRARAVLTKSTDKR
jgi:hypothetical protein